MARPTVFPSSGSGAGTNPKLAQSIRISKEETLQELTTPTTSLPRTLWNCLSFAFLRSSNRRKQSELPSKSISEYKIFQAVAFSASSLCRMEPDIEATPYRWPHDGSLDPKSTALIIIDMQMDFCSPQGYIVQQGYDISAAREIIPRLQHLLLAFRAAGFPIYHTREGHRPDLSTLSSRELIRSKNNASGLGIGDMGPLGRLLIRGEKGHSIIPELTPMPNENIIDKPGRSAFQHTELKLMLNIKGIKNLVLCGVTTDVCVHSTMREANDNDFDCLLVEDCTAASEPHLHTGAIESVKAEGGIFGAVSDSKKIIAAISRIQPPNNAEARQIHKAEGA